MDDRFLTSVPSETLDTSTPFRLSIEEAAVKWLETKFARTGSEKTKQAYKTTLAQFDMYVRTQGSTLGSDTRQIALYAQTWASVPMKKERVSLSTVNQRLAILSSFYTFAIKQGVCEHNPIDYVERPPRNIEHAALPLDKQDVTAHMQKIDTTTLEGKRDKALLSLALTTGRRASELANLIWEDITVTGTKITVTWARCKGAKVMVDELQQKTIAALLDYLKQFYGPQLERIKATSPVFVSLSRNNYGGKLSIQAFSDICERRLGTSQFHVTRHTFSITMEDAGASLSEIGERLGHSNYKVTADYMKRLHSSENKYAEKLEEMFGI